MTREEILSLPAGPDLDRLVKRHALDDGLAWLFEYSTRLADAWMLVDALSARGVLLTLEDRRPDPGWVALFWMPDGHDTGDAVADTPALAVCRAALLVPERYLR